MTGMLHAAVEALASEWECEPDPSKYHRSACPSCHRAGQLREALAADVPGPVGTESGRVRLTVAERRTLGVARHGRLAVTAEQIVAIEQIVAGRLAAAVPAPAPEGGREGLVKFFHRELGTRCEHSEDVRATCEAWAAQFRRTGPPLAAGPAPVGEGDGP